MTTSETIAMLTEGRDKLFEATQTYIAQLATQKRALGLMRQQLFEISVRAVSVGVTDVSELKNIIREISDIAKIEAIERGVK